MGVGGGGEGCRGEGGGGLGEGVGFFPPESSINGQSPEAITYAEVRVVNQVGFFSSSLLSLFFSPPFFLSLFFSLSPFPGSAHAHRGC